MIFKRKQLGEKLYVGFNWDATIRDIVKPIDGEIYQRVMIIMSPVATEVIKRVIPKAK